MPTNATAIWAALAATFSALSSFLIWRVQRLNLFESARPELILAGWSRGPESVGGAERDVIRFQTILNGGKGAAFHVYVTLHQPDLTMVGFSTINVPILPANQESDVYGKIRVWWEAVRPDQHGDRSLRIALSIQCLDARGMHHETRYELVAITGAGDIIVGRSKVAEGVWLMSRETVTQPAWRHTALWRLSRIPLVSRLFRKQAS